MEDDKVVLIPRNLTQADSINLGLGVNLEFSNIPFIICGTLVSYLISEFTNDIVIKTCIFTSMIGSFYLVSKIKYRGQDLTEVCLNKLLFSKRKNYYNKKRGIKK